LGLALTHSVLARGDYVIATARSLKSFDELRQDPTIDGERLRFLALDVTSPMAEIQQCLDEALAVWGRIDVLVNNAGTITYGASEELG
jgi:NAD(P)-dependent dehydrogenase (short-subunit alcohol dehydrogenase family)